MALEELQSQISLLVSQINNQPEDVHELYEQLHQKLNELRSTGQPLPQDLIDLEKRMLKEFPKPKKIILPHIQPAPAGGRRGNAVDDFLDLQSFGKIHVRLLIAFNAIQKMLALNHLKFIESQLMPRRRRERPIGRMQGSRQYRLEAALGRRFIGNIELQFIHPLLVKGNHALGAMHFDADHIFPPMRRAACHQNSRGAAVKAHHGMGNVFIFHRALFIEPGTGRILWTVSMSAQTCAISPTR